MSESLGYSTFLTTGKDNVSPSLDSPRIAQELWQTACHELSTGNLDAALSTLARALLIAHTHGDPLEATIREAENLAQRWRDFALQREHHRHALELDEREMQQVRTQIESLMTNNYVAPQQQNLLSRIIAITGRRAHLAEPIVNLNSLTVGSGKPVLSVQGIGQPALPLTPLAQLSSTRDVVLVAKPKITVHVFGALRIAIDDQPVGHCASSRARLVFTYLVTNRDAPVPRDVLMDQFWHDADPHGARNSLNVALHSLRSACKAIGATPIVIHENSAYRLNPDIDLWVDVDEFLSCSERGQQLEASNQFNAAIESYEQALALYQGDFLSDSPYEDWAALLREKLRLLYLDVLDRLSLIYLSREQYATCITLCQLILARDNCREDAHCRLMRCYARQDQHHLALRQYQACVEALRKELDVPPDAKTIALWELIRKREWV